MFPRSEECPSAQWYGLPSLSSPELAMVSIQRVVWVTHLLPEVTSSYCLLSSTVVLLLGLHLVRRVLLGVGVLSSAGLLLLLLGVVVILPASTQGRASKATDSVRLVHTRGSQRDPSGADGLEAG